MVVTAQPIQILERGPWVVFELFFAKLTTNGRAFEIEGLVDVAVRREKVIHNNKVDLPAVGYLDPVQAVELGDERVWIVADVRVVVAEDFAEEFVFSVMNSLDDVFVVAREVEEAPALPGRAQL